MAFVEKMLNSFRNIKEDAVPRAPRPVNTKNNPPYQEPVNSTQEPASSTQEPTTSTYVPTRENIFIDPHMEFENNTKPSKNKKQKQKRQNCGNGSDSRNSSREHYSNGGMSIINENVGTSIGIWYGQQIQVGPTFYYGPTMINNHGFNPGANSGDMTLCQQIKSVMEAKIKPDHKYLHHVAQNLKNWKNFVENLGFSKQEIDEMVFRSRAYGPKEACYKLLLQWVDRSSDNTLGRLADYLWQKGESKIVEKLSEFYEADRNL